MVIISIFLILFLFFIKTAAEYPVWKGGDEWRKMLRAEARRDLLGMKYALSISKANYNKGKNKCLDSLNWPAIRF